MYIFKCYIKHNYYLKHQMIYELMCKILSINKYINHVKYCFCVLPFSKYTKKIKL